MRPTLLGASEALDPSYPARPRTATQRLTRATHYFVEKQIVGVDADFVRVARVTESEYLLQGLPTGATLRVRIVAANEAGEAPPSDAMQIVVE